ncbi:hypothetical protein FJT64_017518 [Amphibalanus amphitrite]|uniref:C2H2-type domain-containing protein n=1 Tax=Amphibalanus amphitrite TaxID=1232801 RepID=A0A6A4X6N3_AMPAM|nr:hypothetical protein FJT64_017518 [Amphibalanus amphitrite]
MHYGGGILCPEPGCGARVRSQQRLSDHRAWHRGETVCSVCRVRLSSKTKLRSHLQRQHGSDPSGGELWGQRFINL